MINTYHVRSSTRLKNDRTFTRERKASCILRLLFLKVNSLVGFPKWWLILHILISTDYSAVAKYNISWSLNVLFHFFTPNLNHSLTFMALEAFYVHQCLWLEHYRCSDSSSLEIVVSWFSHAFSHAWSCQILFYVIKWRGFVPPFCPYIGEIIKHYDETGSMVVSGSILFDLEKRAIYETVMHPSSHWIFKTLYWGHAMSSLADTLRLCSENWTICAGSDQARLHDRSDRRMFSPYIQQFKHELTPNVIG